MNHSSRIGAVAANHDLTADLERHAASSPSVLANSDGSILMTEAVFDPFDGHAQATPFLKLGLNLGPRSRIFSQSESGHVEGVWNRGAIVSSPGGMRSYSRTARVHMLGLAVRTDRIGPSVSVVPRPAVHEDPVIASVLKAMWMSAADHGLSSAFFEHGTMLVLERLAGDGRSRNHPTNRGARLQKSLLCTLRDAIEASIDEGLTVRDMASLANMDTSTFSRAFARTTGLTPYAYLTEYRMQRAKSLLEAGKPVTEVAGAVGYSNPSKFASMFRRCTGCPPSRWAQRNN